jgi:ATP-dependent Clp protease ATP-binding subunit ClpB
MIQRELETALARKILLGEIRDGAHVVVDANPQGLSFTTREQQNAAA